MTVVNFILFVSMNVIPSIYPFLITLLFSREKPSGWSKKVFLLTILLMIGYLLINNIYGLFILASYGGEFVPSLDFILGRFLVANIIQGLLLLLMMIGFLIINNFITLSLPLFDYPFDENVDTYGSFSKNQIYWLIAIGESLFYLFFITGFIPYNVAVLKSVWKLVIDIALGIMWISYIGISVWLITKLAIFVDKRIDWSASSSEERVFIKNYFFILFSALSFIFVVIILSGDIFPVGIAAITGRELYLPITIFGGGFIGLLLLTISPTIITMPVISMKLKVVPKSLERLLSVKQRMKQLGLIIIMIIFIGIPFVTIPIIEVIPTLEISQTALKAQITISNDPVEEYPIYLSNLRVVSRTLASDISLSRLPSPPKGYSLKVLSDMEVIGMIEGRPAWIIPMRYESFLNKETNIIAGYIAVWLDDPIPEHIKIVFTEMKVGPGLEGFRNIEWIARQVRPFGMIGEISFMDPYINGEPAWLVVFDKYNEWGLRIPDTILAIHPDANYEFIDITNALSVGFPEVISETSFKNIVTNAGKFLRNGVFDPTANGLITIPPSPDRVVDLDPINTYYQSPHHFLTGVNRSWFGRMYYQKATTGDRESVMLWCLVNGTITLYDFRTYSRGGAIGVNTPDNVMNDLSVEISRAFSGITNYYVQNPILYKTSIDNVSTLVWVSLLVQRKQGADELVGAAFIDAANTRIVGVKSRAVGESLETFKNRLTESIIQTYKTFGTDEQAGESQTIEIANGTILSKEWTGFDQDGRKTYVMKIRDNTTLDEYYLVVKWSEAGTGADYYRAAAAKEGENYYFKARFDKDEQVFVMINCQIIS